MSIMLEGTLAVQRISGIHGEFSVGKLETEVGVLNLKDPHLDQYETGKYAGRFLVDRIFPHGYMSKTNCFIVEIRAVVKEYIIHTDEPEELDTDVGLTEMDPLEATPSPVPTSLDSPVLPSVNPSQDAVAPKQDQSNRAKPVTQPNAEPRETAPVSDKPQVPQGSPDAALAELFGELWPLAQTVTLDPTTIRSDAENHRKRTQYLKSQGYLFKATSQSWVKQSSNDNQKEEVTVL
jgi:hypothetical protein